MPGTGQNVAMLIRLLDGTVRFLCDGVDALERGDSAAFVRNVARARQVLGELDTLADGAQGPVAVDLHDLYAFMTEHLHRAQTAADAAAAREVTGLLEELNQGLRFIAGDGMADDMHWS